MHTLSIRYGIRYGRKRLDTRSKSSDLEILGGCTFVASCMAACAPPMAPAPPLQVRTFTASCMAACASPLAPAPPLQVAPS
eukprot:2930748-Prymnesium_polylepis.1